MGLTLEQKEVNMARVQQGARARESGILWGHESQFLVGVFPDRPPASALLLFFFPRGSGTGSH